jgi:hypothetical protein
MRWTRPGVAAALAGITLMAAVVGAAVEDAPTPWPVGFDLPAIEADGTRTFSISPGDEVTFPPGIARPGDVIVCEGKGDITVGPPDAGVGSSAGIEASTDGDGVVHVSCASGPVP